MGQVLATTQCTANGNQLNYHETLAGYLKYKLCALAEQFYYNEVMFHPTNLYRIGVRVTAIRSKLFVLVVFFEAASCSCQMPPLIEARHKILTAAQYPFFTRIIKSLQDFGPAGKRATVMACLGRIEQ